MKILTPEALTHRTAGASFQYHFGYALKGAKYLAMLRKLYDEGVVDLFQRRERDGFAYIVYFRHRPAKIQHESTFRAAGLI